MKQTKFLDLNDDCIFGVLYLLSDEDLLNSGKVCSRMLVLAREVLSKTKKGGLTITIEDNEWMKMKSYIRFFSAHIKRIRLVSNDKFFMSDDTNADIGYAMRLLRQLNNLEYLEVEVPSYISATFFLAVSELKNLGSLKIYSHSGVRVHHSFKLLEQLKHLAELVWCSFSLSVNDLFCMIKNGKHLQRIIVVISSMCTLDHNVIDKKMYEGMLNVVSHRPSGTKLDIRIVGVESQIKKFMVEFPQHELLKISCTECRLRRIHWLRF